MNKNRIFSLPNFVSLFRLLLLVPIIYLLAHKQRLFALAVIMLSGFSDFLDGFIARKWNLQSDAGRIIDPMVDKISLVGLMIFLVISPDYKFPIWFLIFVAFRESMVLLFSLIFIERNEMVLESSTPGKVSAFAIGVTIILFVLNLNPFMWIMVWLSIILTLYSTLVYFKRFKQLQKENKRKK